MNETRNLFDSEEGKRRRDRALRSIDRHADNEEPEWKRLAFARLVQLAGLRDGFTADDLWLMVDKPTGVDSRALGAIMKHAQSAGLIVSTGGFRTSQSATRQSGTVRVWIGKQWAKCNTGEGDR